MTCNSPISWADLVQYWSGDLAPAEVDAMDEHLMGCALCSAESARVSAVVEGLRELIPPVITRARLARLRAGGLRITENTFAPGQTPVVFPRHVELLVHRLSGFDLSRAVRVSVTVRVESTGATLVEDPAAPFDVEEGVLIACQKHYGDLPPDIVFDVRAFDSAGAESVARYSIPHAFEP
jgi:anti-sigma factor RsiW